MENYIQLKNKQIFIQEIKDKTKIDIKELYELYRNEFVNACESILIENQNDFLDNFYNKMNLIIKSKYGENIFEENTSLYLTKKQCENNFVTDIYWPMRNLCSAAINNYATKANQFKDFLVNFRPHCIYDQVPLHTCGSKFIQIYDGNDRANKKKVLYVVCSGCNKCYYTNCIKMNCHYCQIDFYSEIINYKNYLFPATWQKYHCNNENLLINEQMHCNICDKLLYIKNNKLFCNNCKEIIDPNTIVWSCKVCNEKFKSKINDIKIYNPLEFKEIEIARRDAFLYKKVCKPNFLPCNCLSKNDIENFDFVHEQNGKCKGIFFYSYVNDKEFLVCSSCKSIFELNKLHWNCPLCSKKFITNELRFYDYHTKKSNFNKNNLVYPLMNKFNSGKKINNSNSQKIIGMDNMNNNYKVYHKNNSYIKKRINSNYNSNNNSINSSANNSMEKLEDSGKMSVYKNKNRKGLSIILNSNNNISKNININNSSKENNSISNKYNINSTAHSSVLTNNINHPQTARKITDSFLSKKDKYNFQNKQNNNKFIEEKKLTIPLTTINKNKYGNANKKVFINKPFRTIEEYINNFNYNEVNVNRSYLNTSIKTEKTETENDSNKNPDEGFINNIKRCFKKFQKNNTHLRDNSLCNNNKSFISQKTDMKFNQIYVPKKHIHKSSAPTTPLYKDRDIKNYYYNIYNSNDQRNSNFVRYNYNNYNKINNRSCERRNTNNTFLTESNNINKNIIKVRDFSGPKIYPIRRKNIIINNSHNFKYNAKNNLVQQRTNISSYNNNNMEKKKSLNNHRNYTNIYPNSNQNNKLSTTINSNNSKCDEDKNKQLNKNRNNNFQNKNTKKNNYTNRNINYNTGFNYKNKAMVSTKEKYSTNILNNSVDEINNISNTNIPNKSIVTNNLQNNNANVNKRKNKRDNNISGNDTLISKYRKLMNKTNKFDKKIEYNSNTRTGNATKKINTNTNSSNLNSTNKNNKTKSKISKKVDEKKIVKDKEKNINNNNNIIINITNDNATQSNDKQNEEEDELKTFNFDEYKIITQLGQGSFGKIYLVQNAKNELFTMKKLVYSEELDVQAVIKEYQMCYRIKHPNVVKILGIYSNKLDKTTYVVYVLMEVGMTDWEKEIKTHIEKKIDYKETELIHIIKQLIDVLSFLQKQNISHRDIKPQNILVFKNNVYKLADFGEAKQLENMTINLACNSLRGTELYMSPLLFNGLRTGQVDIRHNVFKSDVYSFGLCILFSGTLEMMSLYDIRKFVEMEDVKKYLNKKFKNKYSDKFIELLSMLLEIHENKRPDFIDLENLIKEWKI